MGLLAACAQAMRNRRSGESVPPQKSGKKAPYGSVLFFATHGSPGWITLSNSKKEWISLGDLARCLSGQCEGCYVHFSACNVLEDKTAVDAFLRSYRRYGRLGIPDGRWVGGERSKPALLSDLMLLNAVMGSGHRLLSNSQRFRRKISRQSKETCSEDSVTASSRSCSDKVLDQSGPRRITSPAGPAAAAIERACAFPGSLRWR